MKSFILKVFMLVFQASQLPCCLRDMLFFLWKQRSSSCQSQIPQWKTNWSRLCFVIIFLGDKGATWRGWIYFWKLELYGANTRAWKFHMFPDSLLYHSSTFHLSLLFLQFLLLMNSLYRCRTEWSHNKRLTALPLAQCETHWHKCEMRKQPTVEISKSSALSYSPAVEKKKDWLYHRGGNILWSENTCSCARLSGFITIIIL